MSDEKTWLPLELIKVTTEYLAGKQVPGPRLDAEVLLCHALGLSRRVDLYAGFERKISGKELASYRELIRRRSLREPVSRILGRREFMGLDFLVTPDVLSPRPETELLVEAALETLRPSKMREPEPETEDSPAEEREEDARPMPDELERLLDSYARDVENADDIDADDTLRPRAAPPPARTSAPRPAHPRPAKKATVAPADAGRPIAALDLGTGSGCVAIALAARLSPARVVAVDASPKALAIAKKNAANAGVGERVLFRQGDWFAGCREGERFDAILSNPPYLVEGDPDIWPEASRYDPPAALYGGKDGLDCYRRIIPDAPGWLARDGWIFLEVSEGQAGRVADMLGRRGFREVATLTDYGGVERVVKARAPE